MAGRVCGWREALAGSDNRLGVVRPRGDVPTSVCLCASLFIVRTNCEGPPVSPDSYLLTYFHSLFPLMFFIRTYSLYRGDSL
jgi:hypothetical protein